MLVQDRSLETNGIKNGLCDIFRILDSNIDVYKYPMFNHAQYIL